MGIEESLQQQLFAQSVEKSSVDKLLGKEEIEKVRLLVKKDKLTRKDLKDVLYLINSAEAKLYNLSAWERYIVTKYYVWVREFFKLAEMQFDFIEGKLLLYSTCRLCNGYKKQTDEIDDFLHDLTKNKDRCTCEPEVFTRTLYLKPRTIKMLQDGINVSTHNLAYLVDFYFNICRLTLSLGGMAFMEFLKTKFEMLYPQGIPGQIIQPQQASKGIFGIGRK